MSFNKAYETNICKSSFKVTAAAKQVCGENGAKGAAYEHCLTASWVS